MPYYEEYFSNDRVDTMSTASYRTDSGAFVSSSEFVLVNHDVTMKSFRTSPHRSAVYSEELLDSSIDPYAYFLTGISERKYRKLLSERGLEPKGDLDRGHSMELCRYTLKHPGLNYTNVYKSFGMPETSTNVRNAVIAPSLAGSGSGSPLKGTVPLRIQTNPASALSTFAQQAYASSAPTAVVFDAAQFLGELREGLPRLAIDTVKNGARFYRGIGSDYLNVEFGWKPFINDILNAAKALYGATSLLSSQNNRVHRSRSVPRQMTSDEFRTSTKPFNWVGMPGQRTKKYVGVADPIGNYGAPPGTSYFLRTTSRTQWFEGEFSSFYRLGFDPSSFMDRAEALINIRLTPSVLWELAPWSWLVDWFLRIGDSIKANELAGSDKLVMHYGYAMEHTVIRDLVSMDFASAPRSRPSGSTYSYYPDLPGSASYTSTTEYKRRIRANPYGFKTGGPNALTTGQWAILGALGLTRSK